MPTDLSRPSVVTNRFGSFDLAPIPGQAIIPINMATGPGRTSLNLRLAKTFGFGKKPEAMAKGGPIGPEGPRIGPMGGGGEHREGGGGRGPGGFFGGTSGNSRYNLTFSVNLRNVFNKVNLANPIGNLSSPLFGQSNSLAGGPFGSSASVRRIDLQLNFSF
jgi:hypothetical protein